MKRSDNKSVIAGADADFKLNTTIAGPVGLADTRSGAGISRVG